MRYDDYVAVLLAERTSILEPRILVVFRADRSVHSRGEPVRAGSMFSESQSIVLFLYGYVFNRDNQ